MAAAAGALGRDLGWVEGGQARLRQGGHARDLWGAGGDRGGRGCVGEV